MEEFVSMEREFDDLFFHDDKGQFNYVTVPGERWSSSKIFLYEGRGYIRDSISMAGDRLYLKCRKSHRKFQPCKGRAIVSNNRLKVKKEHSCLIREWEFQILAAKNRMKAEAYMTALPLNDIYHGVLNDFSEDIATGIGYHNIVSCLKDARMRRYQRGGCTAEELCTYLDSDDCLEEFKTVCHGTVHFAEDNGTKHFAVILGSPAILAKVGIHNNYLLCDATFKTSPRPFMQLFNVMVSYEGIAIPILHVCMTSKHHALYEGVMLKIRTICPQLEPRIIKSDFEIGLMKALHSAFPSTTLSGCYFHFAQSVFRAIMRPGSGLSAYYHNNDENGVKKILRRYLALCLLPANEIPVECDRIKRRVRGILDPAARRKLLIFHESYIVGFWVRKVRPERFSVYMHTYKTNNYCESFHRKIGDRITFNANFFRFLSELANIVFIRTERLINQLEKGEKVKNDLTPDQSRHKAEIERLEKKYHDGELSATRMLDEASHFFDGWTVHTLDDDWNERYGQYIIQIDEPRSADAFEELNRQLPDIDVDVDEHQPPAPPPGGPLNGPVVRTFNACAVCYGELDHGNWWLVRPCKHCFCESCVKVLYPPKRDDETYGEHYQRVLPCPTCRGIIMDVEKIFPNYVTLHEGDHVIPVVHDDDNQAAAGAAAAAAVALEEELEDDGADVRRAENQRIVADLIHSNRHRGRPNPNHQWDTLEDEIGLEDFDLTQPHSQNSQQRPLPVIGEPRARRAGRRGGRGRGGRGGRSGSQPRDQASQAENLSNRAQSILKKGKQPLGRYVAPKTSQTAAMGASGQGPSGVRPGPSGAGLGQHSGGDGGSSGAGLGQNSGGGLGSSGACSGPSAGHRKKRVRIIGSSSESD